MAYHAKPRPNADRCRLSTRPAASVRVCTIDHRCRNNARRDITMETPAQG
jgi:hypothetical protein